MHSRSKARSERQIVAVPSIHMSTIMQNRSKARSERQIVGMQKCYRSIFCMKERAKPELNTNRIETYIIMHMQRERERCICIHTYKYYQVKQQ